MNLGRLVFWLLLIACGAVYATMLVWTLPAIRAEAGGLIPFDLHPAGYDYETALAFLTALEPAGYELYLGKQHWLDTAFPVLLGLTLAWLFLRFGPGHLGRVLLVAASLAAAGFDLLENFRVRVMLEAGAGDVTEDMVAAASLATQIKSGLVTLCMTALLLLLLWHGFKRLKGRVE